MSNKITVHHGELMATSLAAMDLVLLPCSAESVYVSAALLMLSARPLKDVRPAFYDAEDPGAAWSFEQNQEVVKFISEGHEKRVFLFGFSELTAQQWEQLMLRLRKFGCTVIANFSWIPEELVALKMLERIQSRACLGPIGYVCPPAPEKLSQALIDLLTEHSIENGSAMGLLRFAASNSALEVEHTFYSAAEGIFRSLLIDRVYDLFNLRHNLSDKMRHQMALATAFRSSSVLRNGDRLLRICDLSEAGLRLSVPYLLQSYGVYICRDRVDGTILTGCLKSVVSTFRDPTLTTLVEEGYLKVVDNLPTIALITRSEWDTSLQIHQWLKSVAKRAHYQKLSVAGQELHCSTWEQKLPLDKEVSEIRAFLGSLA